MHKYFLKKFYFINSFKKNNIDKLDNNTGVIFRNYKNKLNVNEIININGRREMNLKDISTLLLSKKHQEYYA